MYTSQTVYDYSCFKIRSRHSPLKVAHKKYQTCRFVDYNLVTYQQRFDTDLFCVFDFTESQTVIALRFVKVFPAQCLQISEVLNKHTLW